jgi:hypothetical protein
VPHGESRLGSGQRGHQGKAWKYLKWAVMKPRSYKQFFGANFYDRYSIFIVIKLFPDMKWDLTWKPAKLLKRNYQHLL